MKNRVLLGLSTVLFAGLLAVWGALHLSATATPAATGLPSTIVKRGDVVFVVHAKAELQGGNTEVLAAPQVGGQALAITSLRESGELVKPGDIVVQFDTTDQEFKLREAQADLAEAEQHLAQAQAESAAKEEEARCALLQARTDLKVAELETLRNPVMPAIVAHENDLAAANAREKVKRLEEDLGERVETAKAGIAIQEAARQKAKVAAETAKRNIESMTLQAKTAGYVARLQNNSGNWQWGSYLPAFQVGDTVRAGVPVAQIPDLKNWEATARIGELDRAHLAVGQAVDISVIALPARKYHGRISAIGGTTGPPWDRRFDCRIAFNDPSPELRPGMSARVRITTDNQRNVLWVPSQAVFDADGRKFVYARLASGFAPRDIKLVRSSESQAVVEGLREGETVALVNPDQMKVEAAGRSGALQAISR